MNSETNTKIEDVLIESLPYIRDFADSVMVVKVGGNAMANPEAASDLTENIIKDIVLLHFVGVKIVVVHGGGPEISEKMTRLGKTPEFIGGLRVTDDETLEIATMVLVGNINTRMVSLINSLTCHQGGSPLAKPPRTEGKSLSSHPEKLGKRSTSSSNMTERLTFTL